MSLAAGLTLGVHVLILALLMAGYAADLVLLGGLLVLLVAGILSPSEALSGFSNTGMMTVAALFVVAGGLRETGAVDWVTRRLLGRPQTLRGALTRMVFPVIGASSFLNNTTIVAALLPAIHDWGRQLSIPPSRLLLPLSYAAILGGTCTVIGTSTNLVVVGLMAGSGRSDLAPPGIFDISPVGIPVALVGGLLLVLTAPWLPDRRPAVSLADDPREYSTELVLPPDSHLIGKSIEQAGLRSLPGVFLMEVDREDGAVLPAVAPGHCLEAGDRLIFVGDVDAMVSLQRMTGLRPASDQVFRLEGDREQRILVEAVVSPRNRLCGQQVRAGRFRNAYQAVIIAVSRHGERIRGRLGDVVLQNGDTLLLEAHPDFVQHHRSRTDFYLVSAIEGARPPQQGRAALALGVLAAMVLVSTLELMGTVQAAWLAAAAMVLLRCLSAEDARRALDGRVLVAIASAFGLGEGLRATGLDVLLADVAVAAGASSPFAGLVAVYIAAALLTELITNNAAAALIFPLAVSLADRLGCSPMPYVIAVMMAASASFLTPIGYQTNLMVYGPGGYRATDYFRLGIPLALATAAATLALIPMWWPL